MTPAIEIRQVHKRFGALHALYGINLEINTGEFFALLGPNGAGKTTLINIIAGLTLASSGSVRVKGHDVVAEYREARRMLGVVPQELVFDPFFTVRETLLFQSGYYGIKKNNGWIDEIIHHLDLADKADTNMRSLSGGMKRRVLVAQALVHKPPVIVLDEPTAGVDVELRQALWRFIKRIKHPAASSGVLTTLLQSADFQSAFAPRGGELNPQRLNRDGHTIVLTTHYLEEAEALCNRVAMLKNVSIAVLESVRNLISNISRHRIRLRLSPDTLPAALQLLAISHDQGYHVLAIEECCQLENVMAALRADQTQILELQILQPDLEEVFVKIMHSAENLEPVSV